MEEPDLGSSADEIFDYIRKRWAGEEEPMDHLANTLKDCEGKSEEERGRAAGTLLIALSLYW